MIKPLTLEHIEDLRKIRNASAVRKWLSSTSFVSKKENIEFWKKFLKEKNKKAFAIIEENKTIGLLKLEKIGLKAWEIGLFIKNGMRGKGFGFKALKNGLRELKKFGAKKVLAKIKAENHASIKCFEKNGFKKTTANGIEAKRRLNSSDSAKKPAKHGMGEQVIVFEKKL